MERTAQFLTIKTGIKVCFLLSFLGISTTSSFAQNKTIDYLKATPASIFDVGMIRLEHMIAHKATMPYSSWPEKMYMPMIMYVDGADEIRFLINKAEYEDVKTAKRDCKAAIISLRFYAGVGSDGNLSYGEYSFFAYEFQPLLGERANVELMKSLDRKFVILCDASTNHGETVKMRADLLSSAIYEETK